jgi:transcriptional regulator with XRE-family HTH domain
MTAQPSLTFPVGEQADETVRRSIKALIEGRGLDKGDVADATGMTRSTLYRKLSGEGSSKTFTAGEVATLAAFFEVPISAIYEGLGGAFLAPEVAQNDGERHAAGRRGARNRAGQRQFRLLAPADGLEPSTCRLMHGGCAEARSDTREFGRRTCSHMRDLVPVNGWLRAESGIAA